MVITAENFIKLQRSNILYETLYIYKESIGFLFVTYFYTVFSLRS